jgi:hypothetical protein
MVEEPLQIGQLRTAFLGGELSVSELIEEAGSQWARPRVCHRPAWLANFVFTGRFSAELTALMLRCIIRKPGGNW